MDLPVLGKYRPASFAVSPDMKFWVFLGDGHWNDFAGTGWVQFHSTDHPISRALGSMAARGWPGRRKPA